MPSNIDAIKIVAGIQKESHEPGSSENLFQRTSPIYLVGRPGPALPFEVGHHTGSPIIQFRIYAALWLELRYQVDVHY